MHSTKTKKQLPFGEGIVDSLRRGAEELSAGRELPTTHIVPPPDPPTFRGEDLVELRKGLRMSQAALAVFLNVSPKTVESWEQGVRTPGGAALRLLQLMKDPALLHAVAAPPKPTNS